MNDNEVERQLREIGTRPVDPQTRRFHLARIDAATATVGRRESRRFGLVAVAAAGLVGFLAGSTGLAMAGALPDPAQDVAHNVLGAVKVDVPRGNRGSCVSQAAKIKDKAAKQAAKDACPKGSPGDENDSSVDDAVDEDGVGSEDSPGKSGDAPGKSGDAPGKSGDAPGKSGDAPGKSGDAPRGNGVGKHADDPCRGRPAWAGPMSSEQRAALHEANSRDACIDDSDDVDKVGTDDESNDDESTSEESTSDGGLTDDSGSDEDSGSDDVVGSG